MYNICHSHLKKKCICIHMRHVLISILFSLHFYIYFVFFSMNTLYRSEDIITQLMLKHVATIFNFHIATNKDFYDLYLNSWK